MMQRKHARRVRSAKTTRWNKFQLRLEQLEDRSLLSVGAVGDPTNLGVLSTQSSTKPAAGEPSHESYVQHLYTDLLGRDADPTGLRNWAQAMDQGMTRIQVAQ